MSSKNLTGITFGLVLLLAALISMAQTVEEIDIDVAPNVLNLQHQGEIVTVHTDISYSLVSGSTVFLNGIEINHWKSDNRGNFVAKFLMSEIKKLKFNVGDYNTLTLSGDTIDEDEFSGNQDILVVNNIPKK